MVISQRRTLVYLLTTLGELYFSDDVTCSLKRAHVNGLAVFIGRGNKGSATEALGRYLP